MPLLKELRRQDLVFPFFHGKDGGDELLRIGGFRFPEAADGLHLPALLHDEDAVAELVGQIEIVADEEVGEVLFLLKRPQQGDDMGLHGDVQRGRGFVDVGYYDVEKGLYHQYMSGLDIDDSVFLQDGHFWLATGTVTLMPNVMLHGEWAFAYTPEGSGSKELSDAWELSLVYKF